MQDRQKGVRMCMDEIGGKMDDATAKKYCSCVLDKSMQKYRSLEELNNKGTAEDGKKMGESCLREFQGKNDNADNEGEKKGGGLFGGDDTEGWTTRDKNSFRDQCESSLTDKGYSSNQARQACDCVLGKLVKRYSSLKEADEKGGESAGAQAMQECAGGNDTDENIDDN